MNNSRVSIAGWGNNGKLIRRRSLFYSIYAWGVPLIIVIIGQILDNNSDLPSNIVKPGFGIKQCWFGKIINS